MDLDKLKKEWNENEIPTSSQEYILNIIHKRSRSALGKLLLIEKISLIILPIFAVLFHYLSNQFSSFISSLTLRIYDIGCICAIIWQIYKIVILYKIDLSKSNMVTCLKKISYYKICIVREFFVGFAFLFVFMASFIYSLWIYTQNSSILFLEITVFLITTITTSILLYKGLYFRQIKKIQTALSEIEYLEAE